MLSEGGFLCIPAVLPILKEVVESYVSEDNAEAQENQEDPTTVILGVVANIFQKIIELLARRLRKEPEEAQQVLTFKTFLGISLQTAKLMIYLAFFSTSCVSQLSPVWRTSS